MFISASFWVPLLLSLFSLTHSFPPTQSFDFAVCSHICGVQFFLLTCSTLRQISLHCCSHEGPIPDLLCTHNKHTDHSAAAVKITLAFTRRNIAINQRSVAENEREQAVQLWLLQVSIGVR